MIYQINNYTYKSFKNYTGPNECFKAKNIFFGYNGKGKTALSKGILKEFLKDPLMNENNYRFFNKDYIKDNLLLENNLELKGIVANFGKDSINVEKQINKKLKELIDISSIQVEIDKLNTKIIKHADHIFLDKKGKLNIRKRIDKNAVDLIAAYQKDLDGVQKYIKDLSELRTITDSDEYEKKLYALKEFQFMTPILLEQGEIDRLVELVNKEYSDYEIPSVLVLSWLEKGIEIHSTENDSNVCKFCGGNLNIQEIKKRIDDYKNDKKQKELLELDLFQKRIVDIINHKNNLIKEKKTAIMLIGDYVAAYFDRIESLISKLELSKDIINKKINDFSSSYSLSAEEIKEIVYEINDTINCFSAEKLKKEKELEVLVNKISQLVKASIALAINEDSLIKESINALTIKQHDLVQAKTRNETINLEIIQLRKSKSTTSDFALFINEILETIGTDFYLDIIENNYTIKHRISNTLLSIDDISEGENNLLALLFFYYELFIDKFQKQYKNEIKTIIVDDPISSVDDINKIYVIELIKNLLHISEPQVFIFTHVWEDFCDLCYGKKHNQDFGIFEIKKNNSSYVEKTNCTDSPYKHDFKEIYNFSKREEIGSLTDCETYHYPNVMRKVLEGFMKFKVNDYSPTLSNKNNVINALCGDVNNASSNDKLNICTLLDVCNIYSHKSLRNPEQLHKCAKYLMRKIRDIDKNHFAAMTNN